MDRSRSKRYYNDYQDNNDQNPRNTRTRFNNYRHRNTGGGRGDFNNGGGGGFSGGSVRMPKNHHQERDPNAVSTNYRILCHDVRAGSVIGKSGTIIKSIRRETGAWINVHQLIPGDEERIIEISDMQRRDPDGRLPPFSPAQEALFMIHDRILESDVGFGFGFEGIIDEDDGGDFGGGGRGSRIATRLVVAKANVGCLLGKGGKIIEHMRIETKTHIRVLPRDHTLPQCVSLSEEIVQIVGNVDNVKKAIAIISSRLRESQLRDRSNFNGRLHPPDDSFPPRDDISPHMNNGPRRFNDGNFAPRDSAGFNGPRTLSSQPFSAEELVFRILCPNEKVSKVMGETEGIMELLQSEVGVEVRVMELAPGTNEQILVISSSEGPDDDLFPAQEALLHIQSQIVDLGPDRDNIVTTKLLIPSSDIGCIDGRDGSLTDLRNSTGASIQILPREDLAVEALGADKLVQIVGEISAARDAVVELTSRLRSNLYRVASLQNITQQAPISMPNHFGAVLGVEDGSINRNGPLNNYQSSEPRAVGFQNLQAPTTTWPSKDPGASGSLPVNQRESDAHEETKSAVSKLAVPLVTRSTLEVVIPEYAINKLITGTRNKLAQISELSGGTVTLVEGRPDTQRVIQISGAPDQVERAQSLLQGFILSTQEDGS